MTFNRCSKCMNGFIDVTDYNPNNIDSIDLDYFKTTFLNISVVVNQLILIVLINYHAAKLQSISMPITTAIPDPIVYPIHIATVVTDTNHNSLIKQWCSERLNCTHCGECHGN